MAMKMITHLTMLSRFRNGSRTLFGFQGAIKVLVKTLRQHHTDQYRHQRQRCRFMEEGLYRDKLRFQFATKLHLIFVTCNPYLH